MTQTADDALKVIENFKARLSAIRTAVQEGKSPEAAMKRLGRLMEEYDSLFKEKPDELTDDECNELVAAFDDAMEDAAKLMDQIVLSGPPAGRA
jgi:hypothetical protein